MLLNPGNTELQPYTFPVVISEHVVSIYYVSVICYSCNNLVKWVDTFIYLFVMIILRVGDFSPGTVETFETRVGAM